MEATGGYEKACAIDLGRSQIPFAIVNAKYIRRYAECDGKIHKTDPIDAAVIAEYAEKKEPRPQAPITDEDIELEALTTRRRQLVLAIVMGKNHLEHASSTTRPLVERDIKDLEAKVEEIEALLRGHISQRPDLARKSEVLTSTKGIGETTAVKLLSLLPEIGSLTHKQAAKMAGLAPIAKESGTMKLKRKCQGGRADLRAALYMPTLSAIRWNPTIRAFRDRLVAKGKPKQLVVIACMRKFLGILNAMVRDDREWRTETQPPVIPVD
jgi:transposase